MPELPEVETIRRQLAPHLTGRRIARREVLDPRWCEPAPPGQVEDAVRGRRIESVDRRGKYLTFALEDEVHLVMHLRMTGNLLLVPGDREDEPRSLRVRFGLDDGNRVLFTDQRRFGTGVVLLGDDALADYFDARLGVEPLRPEFTAEALRALAPGPARAGQGVPAQPGADRRGGQHLRGRGAVPRPHPPAAAGGHAAPAQLAALRDAVVESLEPGIDARGATIDDFRNADGAYGSFQDRFLVHLREGEPCARCGTTDPQDPRGRPGDLLLPEVPAAAAGVGGSSPSRPA